MTRTPAWLHDRLGLPYSERITPMRNPRDLTDARLQSLHYTIWAPVGSPEGKAYLMANKDPEWTLASCYQTLRPHIGKFIDAEIDQAAKRKAATLFHTLLELHFDYPRYADILDWNERPLP